FMVDLGRTVFSLSMLKRTIRILHRLKMNQLHVHLYDDELCGLRFDGFPFGKDNPYALSMDDISELIHYAHEYHIEIIPELEAWGHVGSLVYHHKELRGGDGMYNGSSFLVCKEMFTLMRSLIPQVVQIMPDKTTIHLGLDEANWFLGPDMPEDYSPSDMVERYYNILQEIGKEQGKDLTLRLWADHAGRPIPKHIQHNIIIEPWQYWQSNYQSIDNSITKYSGEEKMRWMAGAGISSGQYRGAYHATRYWCQQAAQSPNVDGINITFWCTNDLEGKFIGLFAGAYYTWNPSPPTGFSEIENYEDYELKVFPIMIWWQNKFRDGNPDQLRKDRGPLVHIGYYLWGEKHGQPVSPEGPEAKTLSGMISSTNKCLAFHPTSSVFKLKSSA
ncbi:MAG: family 20 glycosylhydrolase, partial [Opitutaceae bacterium]|nr:family 20 glycosylhydrolase [Opitutaceae bacterium]